MEKINGFLNKIYGNAQNMMYFYIILGALALFFVILIIITLIQSSKENKKVKKNEEKEIVKESKEENIKPIENNKEIVQPDEKTINVNLNSEKEINEPKIEENIDDRVYFEEPTTKEPNVYLDKNDLFEETKEIKFDNLFETKTNETTDLFKEESKKEDYTIEMPKVKTIDIDDYLFRREEQESKIEVPKENQEETSLNKEESVTVSNDELKARLAKLNTKSEVTNNENDPALENLMKAVGLEDTMVIPKMKDEKSILGK